ncbi:MAG: transporter permease, partial [Verrucomicrobiales bacterium]|nr:transporter permease [Verrucomicrobiales bacterium]
MIRRLPSYGFLLFIMVVMGCFFIYPIFNTLREAFTKPGGGFTMEYVGQIFSNPLYREGLLNALKMAAGSTIGAMILALPLAVLSARFSFPGKAFLGALVLVPLILPPFVGTIGVKQILGQHGALNSLLMPGQIAAGTP